MKQPKPYDPAEDLWSVIVSFVMYAALLLVLNRVLFEEGGLANSPLSWRLQDEAALVMGVWGVGNLLGYFLWRRRPLWMLMGVAQVLAADSFYRMGEVDWLWLCLTTLALVLWGYGFQLAITAAVTGGRLRNGTSTPEPPPPTEAFCGIVPPGDDEETEAETWHGGPPRGPTESTME
jgi:hypothetical protein